MKHTASAHDVYRVGRRPLDAIFAPDSVAVIGATERAGSVGRTILWNLITNSFGGTVYPVNPKRPSVLGIKAYKSISEVPDRVDLAVIVTPARTVPGVVRECVEAGVEGAIIISAGFKEIGPEGVELERQILAEARKGRMRIVGPNCVGVMNPLSGLNATFAGQMALPGSVGFISQSGALCTSILDWSFEENVGFSAFVSIGSMLDVGWGDLIYYLGRDSRTKSIVIYMESIGDARSFMSAAREVALSKPIIVIKPGRTEAAAAAAASHTGSLTGSDGVLAAAFRRVGVLRVENISDLFNMAEVLAKQPRPNGKRLGIVTNAGGPGVLATDALITNGGELAELSDKSIAALDSILPPHWSHGNPVDILGDADRERYSKSLEIVMNDDSCDGTLVILSPQAMTDPTTIADELKQYSRGTGKPVLSSWMGGVDVAAGERILNQSNIPTFRYPDTAARMFTYMWKYSSHLQSLYETPQLPAGDEEADRARAEATEVIDSVRASGRTLLTEFESKRVMTAYGIPTVETRLARSADEAVSIASEIGFPTVLKLNSETITHKTDVGGVRLDLDDEDAVRTAFDAIREGVLRHIGTNGKSVDDHFQGVTVQPMEKLDGYELIMGSSIDPQFGPVLLFGAGGTLVEVFRDRALGLPPLNTTLARRMMEDTKIYKALKGVRGRKAVDLEALDNFMVRFSHLVVEQPWIKEVDINPLLASEDRIVALDARIVLHDPDTETLPKTAIRPYPSRYAGEWSTDKGTKLTIRPIRPEDEPHMHQFHSRLSEQSVYQRYMQALKFSQRVEHSRLTRICFIDYDREMALVAEKENGGGEPEILAVGRLSKEPGTNEAEFSIIIIDEYQRHGIGTE
ncbi:MAG: bifunctional acetate--CoA ligase family protein/GNAT family N-acetyltransferase, partial [Rhodothermia bacterium]|nr:bifunctional acetate--CoA ligase family protein/GNAT family N-acetyltransferase [Rhodothermia bacterium]